MTGAKKKAKKGSGSRQPGEQRQSGSPGQGAAEARPRLESKSSRAKPPPRKRGWRDIEAITERARLKKMLVDIWHEDIELDEDIFGESDHLAGYYTNVEEEIEVEIDDDDLDDDEEFEDPEE